MKGFLLVVASIVVVGFVVLLIRLLTLKPGGIQSIIRSTQQVAESNVFHDHEGKVFGPGYFDKHASGDGFLMIASLDSVSQTNNDVIVDVSYPNSIGRAAKFQLNVLNSLPRDRLAFTTQTTSDLYPKSADMSNTLLDFLTASETLKNFLHKSIVFQFYLNLPATEGADLGEIDRWNGYLKCNNDLFSYLSSPSNSNEDYSGCIPAVRTISVMK